MPVDSGLIKKNHIQLSDYPYQRDLENRLFMSHLTLLDVQFLEEIVYGPLNLPKARLLESLSINTSQLSQLLSKFINTNLFSDRGDHLLVDKEMRRYFEIHLAKFDEDFEPDIDFLKGLLKLVPIDVLPTWYAISRSSNDIVASIVEKYLHTPKCYLRYLSDTPLEDPMLQRLAESVFNAPDFCLTTKELQERHGLSERQLMEALLLLEFHFLCCLTYRQTQDGTWEGIVSLFHEWKTYLCFLRDTLPKSLKEEDVEATQNDAFGFVNDMQTLLKDIKTTPLPLKKTSRRLVAAAPIDHLKLSPNQEVSPAYLSHLLGRLNALHLIKIDTANVCSVSSNASAFLALAPEKQALSLYNLSFTHFEAHDFPDHLFNDRFMRNFEKSLCRIAGKGWIEIDAFIAALIIPLHVEQEISLNKKGGHWSYALPQYSDDEKRFLSAVLTERLMESGIVRLGKSGDVLCFSLTPFGKKMICYS